ncbi:hypothetical protein GGX14DRAFT_384541 [Mycena pura]|uniref:Uncharacterized protein n=1 Tax=Mycena pura TaxID=153505 RepID=A0AAD6YVL4_9AGAR|nr:hypothetical protein GGX14DRAFT_384541 [Mycena pura]
MLEGIMLEAHQKCTTRPPRAHRTSGLPCITSLVQICASRGHSALQLALIPLRRHVPRHHTRAAARQDGHRRSVRGTPLSEATVLALCHALAALLDRADAAPAQARRLTRGHDPGSPQPLAGRAVYALAGGSARDDERESDAAGPGAHRQHVCAAAARVRGRDSARRARATLPGDGGALGRHGSVGGVLHRGRHGLRHESHALVLAPPPTDDVRIRESLPTGLRARCGAAATRRRRSRRAATARRHFDSLDLFAMCRRELESRK